MLKRHNIAYKLWGDVTCNVHKSFLSCYKTLQIHYSFQWGNQCTEKSLDVAQWLTAPSLVWELNQSSPTALLGKTLFREKTPNLGNRSYGRKCDPPLKGKLKQFYINSVLIQHYFTLETGQLDVITLTIATPQKQAILQS